MQTCNIIIDKYNSCKSESPQAVVNIPIKMLQEQYQEEEYENSDPKNILAYNSKSY